MLTRSLEYDLHYPGKDAEGIIAHSVDDALELCKKFNEHREVNRIMVIGGETIFESFATMRTIQCVYLTLVDDERDGGDAFFPMGLEQFR